MTSTMRPASAERFELLRALATLCERPDPSHGVIGAALGLQAPALPEEHTAVFVLQCHPHASCYLSSDGMLGGEAGDRVAGFWRALGLEPPAAPDHLAALLGLYTALGVEACGPASGEAARAGLEHAREALFWEHLASWAPALLAAVSGAGSTLFTAWAELLGSALAAEAEAAHPPSRLPLALRQAPGPPALDSGAAAMLDAVLAPARSGVVLTRGRLLGAARGLGVGSRQGERRFMLQAMLDQDTTGTLGWIAGEAARWAELHRRWMPAEAGIRSWWTDRAAATAGVFETLARRTNRR